MSPYGIHVVVLPDMQERNTLLIMTDTCHHLHEHNRRESKLRYDDRNPEKEEERVFTGIKEMVLWLGESRRLKHVVMLQKIK